MRTALLAGCTDEGSRDDAALGLVTSIGHDGSAGRVVVRHCSENER